MKKKYQFYLITAIAFIAIAVTVFMIWYHRPIEINQVIEVYDQSDNNSCKKIQTNFVINRYLLSPNKLSGQFQLDDANDKVYISWKGEETGFFQKLQMKISGKYDIPVWINSANLVNPDLHSGETGAPIGIDNERILSDLIYIPHIEFGDDYTLDSISLLIATNGDASTWRSNGKE